MLFKGNLHYNKYTHKTIIGKLKLFETVKTTSINIKYKKSVFLSLGK